MDLKAIAADIIADHAQDVEYMSIFEMYDELTPEEGDQVDALIHAAIVTVSWPDA